MHPNRRKGVQFERDVAAWLNDNLGGGWQRRYNLGTHDDIGDIVGPGTVIQCANWKDVAQAVRHKPVECEEQRLRDLDWRPTGQLDPVKGTYGIGWLPAPFAATFIRLRGGDMRVVLTPEQFACLWREATA